MGSSSELLKHPDFILLSLYDVGPLSETYKLPILLKNNHHAFVPFQVHFNFLIDQAFTIKSFRMFSA